MADFVKYQPKTWASREFIKRTDMNHLEEGVGNNSEAIDALIDDVATKAETTALNEEIARAQAAEELKLNAPAASFGTEGQLLRTRGDGTTEWATFGSPSSAQVDVAVSEWLDEHPEATTTIQNGAVTKAKLDANLQESIDKADQSFEDIDTISSTINDLSTSKVDGWYVENGTLYLTANGEIVGDGGISGIGGGGGGGGGGSTTNAVMTARKVESWSAKTVAVGSSCYAVITWSSLEDEVETGNGTLKVLMSGSSKAVLNVPQGEISINLAKYANEGSNSFVLELSDAYGQTRRFSYTLSVIQLTISSTFDTSIPYTDEFDFVCNMTGNVRTRTVYIKLDGVAQEPVTSTYKQYTFHAPQLTHGAHTIEAWFSTDINDEEVESNKIYYEFMYVEEDNTDPIITSNFNQDEVDQYNRVNIPYRVYSPSASTVEVSIYENDVLLTKVRVNSDLQNFNYHANTAGEKTIKLQVSEIIYKEFTFTVNPTDITITPEEQNLMLYLSAVGRSNNEEHPNSWSYGNIAAQFNNFSWILDGWSQDDEGEDVLRLSGDARLVIPYQIFNDTSILNHGKTIEIEFATREVRDYSATILSCFSDNIGLRITPQSVMVKGAQTSIDTLYKDNEHIRLSITIDKQTDNRLILVYIDGIMSRAVQYASGENFKQSTPANISIGSNDCSIDIYNIRVYNNNLTANQIINNWIADSQSGSDKLERYTRNNILNDNEEITIESLNNRIAYMVIEAPQLPQFKGDKKTNIAGRYVDPFDSTKSFTFTGCEINAQGTSSSVYYVKNIDMKFKNGFEMSTGHAKNYALHTGSIPFNRFVLKADVASSESTNNTGLVDFYNDTCPYKVPEMIANSKVRWGIEGVPIVMFWYDTNTATTKFMGKYNFNLPKRAPAPYGYSGMDESWEWERNNSANVKFQDNDFETMAYDSITDTSYPEWYDDFEARFPDDTHRDITQLNGLLSFVKSTDRAQATNANLPESVTYILPSASTVSNYSSDTSFTVEDEIVNGANTGNKILTFTKDTPAYRLTKFRAEFPKYAELQSAEYYYLFTELFLMIDSRAKNMFVGFHGSEVTDSNIPLRRKAVFEPYDMDTAVGTNNSGILMFSYNLEDTDTVDSVISGGDSGSGSAMVFNAQDSVLWCNFRDAFRTEIVNMYRDLRTGNNPAWSYNAIESRYEAHQSAWSEAIFDEDARVKYLTPLTEAVTYDEETKTYIKTPRYLTMLQGSKKEQRKWWLYNRFRYMDSKYLTGDASARTIDIRLFNSGRLAITSAIDMYTAVRFGLGSTPQVQRSTANEPAYYQYGDGSATVQEMETSIYSADMITDVGDLSVFYPNECNFSRATRLKRLKIGDSTAGYSNGNLKVLDVKNSTMLEYIDCRNCPNLDITVNLEGSPKLQEAYFDNTSITGVDLADGGELEVLHLPGTITTLTLMNLSKLRELVIPDYSNISRLMLANMDEDIINPLEVLDEIDDDAAIYLEGLDFTANSASEIEALFTQLDGKRGVTREWDTNNEAWIYHFYDTARTSVNGVIHIDELTGAQYADFASRYPYIQIDATNVVSTLYYYDTEGNNILYQESVTKNGNGTYPGTPAHSQTDEYTYTFIGWSLNKNSTTANPEATKNVIGDRNVYAAYRLTRRTHTVRFFDSNKSTVLKTYSKEYGTTLLYDGTNPTHPTDPTNYVFNGWATNSGIKYYDNMPVQGTWDFYPQFKDMRIDIVTHLQDTMTNLNNSTATAVGEHQFEYISSLQTVALTNSAGVDIDTYAFSSISKLTEVEASAKSIGENAFINCSNLTVIDLTYTGAITIAGNAFMGCKKLTHVIIRSNSVASLAATNAFNATKISIGVGGIYVPSALLTDYKSATNWSTYADNIYPIEEYPKTDFSTITDSWTDIKTHMDAGDYNTRYKVGDIKLLTLNDTNHIQVYMQVAAFDTDTMSNDSKAKITWLCKECYDDKYQINTSSTTTGGWAETAMHSWLNETVLPYIPSEVSGNIVEVKKSSWDANTSAEISTVDKLWIPSNQEVNFVTNGNYHKETNGVTYSGLFPTATNSSNTARIKHDSTGSTSSWWLRSSYSSSRFVSVSASGNASSDSANNSIGVVFGFCMS